MLAIDQKRRDDFEALRLKNENDEKIRREQALEKERQFTLLMVSKEAEIAASQERLRAESKQEQLLFQSQLLDREAQREDKKQRNWSKRKSI